MPQIVAKQQERMGEGETERKAHKERGEKTETPLPG